MKDEETISIKNTAIETQSVIHFLVNVYETYFFIIYLTRQDLFTKIILPDLYIKI